MVNAAFANGLCVAVVGKDGNKYDFTFGLLREVRLVLSLAGNVVGFLILRAFKSWLFRFFLKFSFFFKLLITKIEHKKVKISYIKNTPTVSSALSRRKCSLQILQTIAAMQAKHFTPADHHRRLGR